MANTTPFKLKPIIYRTTNISKNSKLFTFKKEELRVAHSADEQLHIASALIERSKHAVALDESDDHEGKGHERDPCHPRQISKFHCICHLQR